MAKAAVRSLAKLPPPGTIIARRMKEDEAAKSTRVEILPGDNREQTIAKVFSRERGNNGEEGEEACSSNKYKRDANFGSIRQRRSSSSRVVHPLYPVGITGVRRREACSNLSSSLAPQRLLSHAFCTLLRFHDGYATVELSSSSCSRFNLSLVTCPCRARSLVRP